MVGRSRLLIAVRMPIHIHLVRVSPNGRREVRVDRFRQPTVRPILGRKRARPEVPRGRDAPCGHEPDHVVEVWVARLACGSQGEGEVGGGAGVEGDALPAERAFQRPEVVVDGRRVQAEDGLGRRGDRGGEGSMSRMGGGWRAA